MFKYLFFRAFAKTFGYLPTKPLIALSGQKQLCPLFHTVSDTPLLHLKQIYEPRTTKQFRADIDFFLKNYRPIDLPTLIKQQLPKEPHFFLSFDDGMSELYHIVMPILAEKGVPATIFLNPDFVDNKQLFYRHKVSLLIEHFQQLTPTPALQSTINQLFVEASIPLTTFSESLINQTQHKHIPFLDKLAETLELDFTAYLQHQKPYLSLSQIHEMQTKGFTFGAHSLNHPQYNHISLADQIHQTQASVEYVIQNAPTVIERSRNDHTQNAPTVIERSRNDQSQNAPIRTFAFPFTDFEVSKDFFTYFHTQYPLDVSFGCAGLKKAEYPNHIQRVETEKGNYRMEDIIHTEYIFYLISALIGKNKIIR